MCGKSWIPSSEELVRKQHLCQLDIKKRKWNRNTGRPPFLDLTWPSLTFLHLFWPPLISFDPPWLSLTFFDFPWHILTFLDLLWLSLTSFDFPWPFLTFLDLLWPSLTSLNVPWPHMIFLVLSWPPWPPLTSIGLRLAFPWYKKIFSFPKLKSSTMKDQNGAQAIITNKEIRFLIIIHLHVQCTKLLVFVLKIK